MENPSQARWPSVTALAAGLCIALNAVTGDRLGVLLPVGGLIAVVSFWGVSQMVGSRLATLGSRVMAAGGGLFAALGIFMFGTAILTGNEPDSVYPAWLFIGFPIGGLAFAGGLILVAVAAMKAGFPKTPFVLMMLGIPVGVAIDAVTGALGSTGGAGIGATVGLGALGLGLLWLGAHLRTRTPGAALGRPLHQ